MKISEGDLSEYAFGGDAKGKTVYHVVTDVQIRGEPYTIRFDVVESDDMPLLLSEETLGDLNFDVLCTSRRLQYKGVPDIDVLRSPKNGHLVIDLLDASVVHTKSKQKCEVETCKRYGRKLPRGKNDQK